MRHSFKVGVSFGLTSGVITTLGLIVGLYSSTRSRLAVAGGVLVIAVADSLSDALGIHISEESENRHSHREIWESTAATAAAKAAVTGTFLIPVLLLDQWPAILASVAWGFLLIGLFSYYISARGGTRPWVVVLEHFLVAAVVIAASHFIGAWIAAAFQ